MNKIICGDCLKILPTLPRAKMIFADPPDNLGMKYEGFRDKNPDYGNWLWRRVWQAWDCKTDILWVSYYHKYQSGMMGIVSFHNLPCRQFIWRFTFGQHRQADCANGYRPILRLMRPGAVLYPDAIRVPSARQKCNDKRADPRGRVPDDVWEFPRIVGNAKERRPWFPNQHPEALIRRIVQFSCKPGDLVIDMFAGSGTVNYVCKDLGIDCIGIEISPYYCQKIRRELKKRKSNDSA